MIRTKRNKHWLRIAVPVVLLILLIAFSHRNPETSRLPSNLLNVVITPFNRFFYSASQSVRSLYDRMLGSASDRAELDRLKLENQALQGEVQRLQNVVEQSPFLENEYALLTKTDKDYLQATVSMEDPSNTFIRFTINRGTKDGVGAGDVVVQGVKNGDQAVVEGLVGIVTEVGLNYAKVSSLMDQASNVSVQFGAKGVYGVINSRDAEQFYGYLMDAQSPVAVGEAVTTSGIGGKYPRGLYIGKVSETILSDDGMTRKVTIDPALDFSTLYRVLVLPGSAPEKKVDHE